MSETSTVKIKICGVRTPSDALACAEAGADYIGINFFPGSPRFIGSIENALALVSVLPGPVAPVLVFVNETAAAVIQTARTLGVSHVQFHGDEPDSEIKECAKAGLSVIRAIRVRGEPGEWLRHEHCPAEYLLLDAHDSARRGGTGRRVDPVFITPFFQLGIPVFLAGGLTPENVVAALSTCRPFGVDCASGAESAPGVKDHEKIRRFVAAARGTKLMRFRREPQGSQRHEGKSRGRLR